MPQSEQFETLVLGCGNGGMYLAWHITRCGRRTAVVERRWSALNVASVAAGAIGAVSKHIFRRVAPVQKSIELAAAVHRHVGHRIAPKSACASGPRSRGSCSRRSSQVLGAAHWVTTGLRLHAKTVQIDREA